MRRIGWRGALGIALSAALLVWAFQAIEFDNVGRSLAQSDPWLFLLSAAVATLALPLRAVRWRVILAPVLPQAPIGPLWRSTAIGVMVNNVLPARAGELARALAASRELPKLPFSAAVASLAVDRVFDAVAILALMLVATLDPAFPPGESIERWTRVGVVAVAALLGALYLVVFFPRVLVAAFGALTRRVAPRLEAKVEAMLLAFASGLGVLRHPGRFIAVLAWTVLFWLVNALAFWIAFEAVGIDAPPTAALFVQGVVAFGVAAPSAPGFVGIFEASAVLGLKVYGVPESAALTWAIGFHVLTYIPITAIGAWYFARLGLHFSDLGAAPTRDGQEDAPDDERTEGSSPVPGATPTAGRRA